MSKKGDLRAKRLQLSSGELLVLKTIMDKSDKPGAFIAVHSASRTTMQTKDRIMSEHITEVGRYALSKF